MIPRTLSASSLQVWALCPARWVAEYMDRTPGFENAAAGVGTTVHGAAEDLVKAVYIEKTHADLTRPQQKDLMITFLQMHYIKTFGAADFDTEEYKDAYNLAINWFARTDLASIRRIESVELKETIKTPYYHPEGASHICDNCKDQPNRPDGVCYVDFNYLMDRVDETGDNEYRVVDYKTIRKPISPEDLNTKIQARAYALAIQIKHPDAVRIQVVFDLLRHQPVGMYFTRESNIKFWQYLTEELQLIVNTSREDAQADRRLNTECGYCVLKYTCPEMQKNVDAGGYHSLTIDDKAALHERLSHQIKAATRIVEEMEEALMLHAHESGELEWETQDGSKIVEVYETTGRRGFNAQRAAEIMGPELFATMGSMTLGNLEKIIKDASLDPDMRAQLKMLISKGNGNLKVAVKPKSALAL